MPARNETNQMILESKTAQNKNRRRYELYEGFDQIPLLNASVLITDTNPTLAQMALRLRANRNFEINGVSPVDADQSFDGAGGVLLSTRVSGASANDNVYFRPHLDTLQTAWAGMLWLTNNEPWFETVLRCDTQVTTHLRAGFFEDTTQPADFASTGSDDNAAFFLLDEDQATSAANWICVVNVDGVDTLQNTGVPFQVAKETRLEIRLDSNRRPEFYINDELVWTGPAMKTTTTLVPMAGVGTDAAGAKACAFKYIRCSMSVPS